MGHNVEHIVGELTECLETLLVSIGDRSGTANLLMTKEFSERCIEALKNSPHLQKRWRTWRRLYHDPPRPLPPRYGL